MTGEEEPEKARKRRSKKDGKGNFMRRIQKIICLSFLLLLMLTGCCLQHEWKEATCTEARTCTKCGKEEGEPLPHEWQEATCTEPRTCTVCGAAEGAANGHTYEVTSCTEPKACSICGEVIAEAGMHNWAPATCTLPQICLVCGAEQGSPEGHKWEGASCTAPKECRICGRTQGQELGHDWESENCLVLKTCKRCGKTEGKLGAHTMTEAACTERSNCSVCGQVPTGEVLGHTLTGIEGPEICPTCGREVLSRLPDGLYQMEETRCFRILDRFFISGQVSGSTEEVWLTVGDGGISGLEVNTVLESKIMDITVADGLVTHISLEG